jgi:hypothetical protein
MTAGTDVGSERVQVSAAAVMLELKEIRALLEEVRPLLPLIPAVVALMDNPAARWKLKGARRG